MDSMRSLNTSLPRASPPKQQAGEPPEQLLAAFKAAALSVTNLYKSAAAKQGKERAEGYQDALDELLAFLDKEDIGLSDGEGWRIRRWATERLDGRDSMAQTESEDEASEKTERASSPILQRSQSTARMTSIPNLTRTASPVRADSPATQPAPTPTLSTPNDDTTINLLPPQSTFTFRASQQYPQDADVILSDLELSDNQRVTSHDGSVTSNATSAGITITRPPRNRHNNHSVRLNGRGASTIQRPGQKRKMNFGEFFDIGNVGQGKDGQGGGKRGRFA
jgi:hypothetical protein